MQAPIDSQMKLTFAQPVAKWVRAYFNGQLLVDTKKAILLGRDRRPPVYFIPKQDVKMAYLTPANDEGAPDDDETNSRWNIVVAKRYVANAAMEYKGSVLSVSLDNYLTFDWSAMDSWFEEQEQVYVHPRDPYVRVDTLHSSRHVKVIIDGETVAETHNPLLLFETGLPVRYYIPKIDVRLDLLIDSDHVTHCPYKGEAHYYSVRIGNYTMEDVAWYYPYPVAESMKIASYVAFYEERVDVIEVDGERSSQFGGD
jgi:uncharacterized protein (DUF427 family)